MVSSLLFVLMFVVLNVDIVGEFVYMIVVLNFDIVGEFVVFIVDSVGEFVYMFVLMFVVLDVDSDVIGQSPVVSDQATE